MNFLETLEELNHLYEGGSDGGQRTYKQFLIFLLKHLGGNDYHDYENWVLHHVDGDHEKNDSFENLVLMDPNDHKSLHGVVKDPKEYDYSERLVYELEHPTRPSGEKYKYISIGKEIENKLQELMKAASTAAC